MNARHASDASDASDAPDVDFCCRSESTGVRSSSHENSRSESVCGRGVRRMLDVWSSGTNAIRASAAVSDSETMPGDLRQRLDRPNARDRRRCKSLNQSPSPATSLVSACHAADARDVDLCRWRSVRAGPTGVRSTSAENSRRESARERGATRVLDASFSAGNAIKTSFSTDDSETMADRVIKVVCGRLYPTNARARRRCQFLIRVYVRPRLRLRRSNVDT